MMLLVFVTGLIGVTTLLIERTHSSREMFYGRAEARAEALTEMVADLVSPALASGDSPSVSRGIETMTRFPNVVSVSVFDRAGALVSQKTNEIEAGPAQDVLETRSVIVNPVSKDAIGEVRAVLSTQSLKETLRNLFWKTLALASLAIFGLAGAAWILGHIVGRRLESLAEVLERIDLDKPLALKQGGSASELDRLARSFNALHSRLLHEKSERLQLEAFKSDLTNMLVHDMKHPITVTGVVLALLQDDAAALDSDKKAHLFGVAKRNIRRENVMIENLLQIAKLKNAQIPLRKTRLNLKSFMEKCAEENSVVVEQDGRKWRLEADESLDAYWIFGDPALLKRLIGNLVFNAIDHSPPEGGITLGARLRGTGAPVVEIFVRDEGAGIPIERREAIFRKYRTSAESTKNAGLGLAFCKLVAEHHAARLELVDSAQPGTTFALVIPASTRPMAPAPDKQELPASAMSVPLIARADEGADSRRTSDT